MCSHRLSDFSEKDAEVVQCLSSLNIILDEQHTEHIGLKIVKEAVFIVLISAFLRNNL